MMVRHQRVETTCCARRASSPAPTTPPPQLFVIIKPPPLPLHGIPSIRYNYWYYARLLITLNRHFVNYAKGCTGGGRGVICSHCALLAQRNSTCCKRGCWHRALDGYSLIVFTSMARCALPHASELCIKKATNYSTTTRPTYEEPSRLVFAIFSLQCYKSWVLKCWRISKSREAFYS